MEAAVPPQYQGNLLCINPEEQCFLGQEPYKRLKNDEKRELIFRQACKERKGGVIRCCPLDLVNITYNPGPLETPHMVQNMGYNSYKVCPEKIKGACSRQSERDQPLCIQEVCNDAGYRVASNYYEICKSAQLSDKNEDVPDCPANGCWGSRFRLPEEITEMDQLELVGADTQGEGRNRLSKKLQQATDQEITKLEKRRSTLMKELATLKAERDTVYQQLEVEKASLEKDELSRESFGQPAYVELSRRLTQLEHHVKKNQYELDEINKVLIKQAPIITPKHQQRLFFRFFGENYVLEYNYWTILLSLILISTILLCLVLVN